MVLPKDELETKLKDDQDLYKTGVLRNEHPLDLSREFEEFLLAIRHGNLKTCQEMIAAGVNINGKDEFDYTPLVMASLCGHYEVVRLLLESGALADPGSFERERAVYNALNHSIRDLLLSYDYSKTADPLQPWSSHITSLLASSTVKTWDIELQAPEESFRLHKFILSSRSPYFATKLAEAPETSTWRLGSAVPVEAFRLVLRYLYLGELPSDMVGPGSRVSEEDVARGIDRLCKKFEIDKLWEGVLSVNDRRLARQRHQDEVTRARTQIGALFEQTVLRHKVVVETRKAGDIKWPHDNAVFANCLLRADEEHEDEDEPDHALKCVLYPVHKAFLIRSPYFETMFSGQFLEAQHSQYLHIIKMDCTPEVLEMVLTYLYTEKADVPLELALHVLYEADMLLLDKLKTKAAQAISTLGSGNSNVLVDRTHGEAQHVGDGSAATKQEHDGDVESINIYDVIHAAWDLRVQRLEEFAARYLAGRLELYIDRPEFAELIRESAARLRERQETDTIELLDDIRYYLSDRFRLRWEGDGVDEMLDGEYDAATKRDVGRDRTEAMGAEGAVRTLDGKLVEDEFVSDALNYQMLTRKIDDLLERLKLDA